MIMSEVIDLVLAQIEQDVKNQDFTAIEEMLNRLPKDVLVAYLPEEKQNA